MLRQKRKASGFDQNHDFWPRALELWRRGYSNTQVAAQAQAEGYDLNEDQVRYARNRYWTADELPARGAKWLREAVQQATEVYPSALEQQQAFSPRTMKCSSLSSSACLPISTGLRQQTSLSWPR